MDVVELGNRAAIPLRQRISNHPESQTVAGKTFSN
jgi:hypothetical protein